MDEMGFGSRPAVQDIDVPPGQHHYPFFLKRTLDFLLSVAILVIASPFLLLVMIGIKLHSPGPVFYRQQRIGKNGVPFDMLKFRSMRIGADSEFHKEYVQYLIQNNTSPDELGSKNLKIQKDPRITGLGKLLRGFGLDEIPQLFNVLKGEMSIVGPRPSLPYEYELYTSWHKQRLRVLPGITGLWQVTAHNEVPFNRMVEIDLEYMRNMSLWNDIAIIVLTPLEMLRRKG